MRSTRSPCGHEVQHLAHRLADRMECAAAARTNLVVDVERHFLARQMVGEPLTPRGGFGIVVVCGSRWMRHLCPRCIGVEVFQSQSKLIAIEPWSR
jgi:hypothetical protein